MSSNYPNWDQSEEIIRELVKGSFGVFLYRNRDDNSIVVAYIDRKDVLDRIPANELIIFNARYNEWVNWVQKETDMNNKLASFYYSVMEGRTFEQMRVAIVECLLELEGRLDCTIDESLYRALI